MNKYPINRKLKDSVNEIIMISKKLELAKTFSFEKYDKKKILKKEQYLPENLLRFSEKIIKHVFKNNFQFYQDNDQIIFGSLSISKKDKLRLSKNLLEKCLVISQEKNKSYIHQFNVNKFNSYDEIKLLIYLSILYKIESDKEKYNYYKKLSFELGKVSELDIDKIFNQIEQISISSDNIVYIPVIKNFIF
jgi:hypothetical protein